MLRWSPLPGAVSYDVQVSTEDLRALATAKGLTATEYRVPESALAGLPSASRLLWQVDAVRPDGTHENSQTFITQAEVEPGLTHGRMCAWGAPRSRRPPSQSSLFLIIYSANLI